MTKTQVEAALKMILETQQSEYPQTCYMDEKTITVTHISKAYTVRLYKQCILAANKITISLTETYFPVIENAYTDTIKNLSNYVNKVSVSADDLKTFMKSNKDAACYKITINDLTHGYNPKYILNIIKILGKDTIMYIADNWRIPALFISDCGMAILMPCKLATNV